MLKKNPSGEFPDTHPDSYICSTAVITGNVKVGKQVFIATNASIRADEPGSQVLIGDGCNIQDNVIIHALANTRVLIGENTSLSHGCIIHGPADIGNNCFIGFGSIVFQSSIGNDCYISLRALVKGVKISAGKLVQDGAIIVKQVEADALEVTKPENRDFALSVINTNKMLSRSYQQTRSGSVLRRVRSSSCSEPWDIRQITKD